MKKWIIDRTQERSTWIGLIGVLTAAGISIQPELQNAIMQLGLAVAGLLAVVTKDK